MSGARGAEVGDQVAGSEWRPAAAGVLYGMTRTRGEVKILEARKVAQRGFACFWKHPPRGSLRQWAQFSNRFLGLWGKRDHPGRKGQGETSTTSSTVTKRGHAKHHAAEKQQRVEPSSKALRTQGGAPSYLPLVHPIARGLVETPPRRSQDSALCPCGCGLKGFSSEER